MDHYFYLCVLSVRVFILLGANARIVPERRGARAYNPRPHANEYVHETCKILQDSKRYFKMCAEGGAKERRHHDGGTLRGEKEIAPPSRVALTSNLSISRPYDDDETQISNAILYVWDMKHSKHLSAPFSPMFAASFTTRAVAPRP